MDREQHITQDAAEHYAVYVMAKCAEDLDIVSVDHSERLWNGFIDYLMSPPRAWGVRDFEEFYPQYKINVDAQVPLFVDRLHQMFPGRTFEFDIDEAEFRKQGRKADFTVAISDEPTPHLVSLKNYVGSSGIVRPQVSSGTFLSFAAGFVFERTGVGRYVDPRTPGASFQGSNQSERNAILRFEGRDALIPLLHELEDLQRHVRDELLSLRFYDEAKIKSVIAHIVPRGQAAMRAIFSRLGDEVTRLKFLERAGLDGTEEVLYFDEKNLVDSITNPRYAALRASVNDPETAFSISPVGQSLRFEFSEPNGRSILATDVPLTINTNGAWHRPKQRYDGTQTKNDKGHLVELEWGELRPYKSRELATSTNTYVNLKATGIFGV